MTQMMLFDSPAVSTPAPVLVPVETPAVVQPATVEHEPGLNHMGDLARLVILRYQLVAKRRAERAQRAK